MTETVSHQALYRRWRAQTFSQIVGQEHVVATLRNAVRSGQVAHALLFVGPRGTGKTSLARIVAKALNCTDLRDGEPCDTCPACVAVREGTTLDLVEIDAASNRGIESIRELRDRLSYPPGELRRKVYILDEAHQLTREAWNALLKSLEEPPDFVVFIFASTEPSGFPPAILSRLQRFDIRRLTVPEIEGKLRMILEADGRTADDEAIGLIARQAAGGMRDAESMLDQLLASGGDRLDGERVRSLLGLAEADAVDGFAAALVRRDAATGLTILDDLEDRGRDIRAFLDQVVEALRASIGARLADPAGEAEITALISAASRLAAIDPTRSGPGGLRLQLELALLVGGAEATTARPVAPATLEPGGRAVSRPVTPLSAAAPSPVPEPASSAPEVAESQPAAATERAAASAARSSSAMAPVTPPDRATPPGDAAALAALRDQWPEIVAYISQHPPTKPLISACRPIAVDGATVTLGFPEGQAFLMDVAERRRGNLEEGIGHFLGRAVSVRCVASNIDPLAEPAGDEAGVRLMAEARRIFGDDLVDVGDVG